MGELEISPLAKRLAEENNVDWRSLQGTGENGRIVEHDVLDFLARVMAGEEAIDPTPEPLPPGMEAWPDAEPPALAGAPGASRGVPGGERDPFASTHEDDRLLETGDGRDASGPSGDPFADPASGGQGSAASRWDEEPAVEGDAGADWNRGFGSRWGGATGDDGSGWNGADWELDAEEGEGNAVRPDGAAAPSAAPDTAAAEPEIDEDIFLFDDAPADEPTAAGSDAFGFGDDVSGDDPVLDDGAADERVADGGGGFWASGSGVEEEGTGASVQWGSGGYEEPEPWSTAAGTEASEPVLQEWDADPDEPSLDVRSVPGAAHDASTSYWGASDDAPYEGGNESGTDEPTALGEEGRAYSPSSEDYPPSAEEPWGAASVGDRWSPSDSAAATASGSEEPAFEPESGPFGSDSEQPGFETEHEALEPESHSFAGETAPEGLEARTEAPQPAVDLKSAPVPAGPGAGPASVPAVPGLSRTGIVLRLEADMTALVRALADVAGEIEAEDGVSPTAFLLRAAVRSGRPWPLGSEGTVVGLASLSDEGVVVRAVPDAGSVSFRELVRSTRGSAGASDAIPADVALVVADLSSFGIDEAVLDLGLPVLTMGRVSAAEGGRYRGTLTLSGPVGPDAGSRFLGRVAELLGAPVRLVL